MSQQGIVGRVMQLARANVSAVIDSAEDPRVMLDDLVFDYSTHIAGAENAITQTVANLHMIEQDLREDARAALQWGKKAQAASRKADELRGSGHKKDADRFDDLARVALERQMTVQNDVATIQHTIDAQNESLAKLKAGVDQMKVKLSELKRKDSGAGSRNSRQSRSRDGKDRIDILDPASEVSRFEEKVRREETRVSGRSKLATSSLDRQFMGLDDPANRTEIEQRLQALKAGRASAARRPAHAQPGKASRVSAARRPVRVQRAKAGVH